ncbi:hypothetical protein HD598_001254 [Neomicrococcus aestuarii]|uniref:Uncharacterized protein n=1 Tax=Neomicrococcus aestuarii TaxID=556325 RepID=A0A7W8TTD1_9MICC|nr:hypothetical protein [Neomicrococcus aestuarii]MBB5512567.1 hypothetical protein [Neomicrococcus aestuarii]
MTNENQKWDREILENDDAALRSALSELQMMGSVEAPTPTGELADILDGKKPVNFVAAFKKRGGGPISGGLAGILIASVGLSGVAAASPQVRDFIAGSSVHVVTEIAEQFGYHPADEFFTGPSIIDLHTHTHVLVSPDASSSVMVDRHVETFGALYSAHADEVTLSTGSSTSTNISTDSAAGDALTSPSASSSVGSNSTASSGVSSHSGAQKTTSAAVKAGASSNTIQSAVDGAATVGSAATKVRAVSGDGLVNGGSAVNGDNAVSGANSATGIKDRARDAIGGGLAAGSSDDLVEDISSPISGSAGKIADDSTNGLVSGVAGSAAQQSRRVVQGITTDQGVTTGQGTVTDSGTVARQGVTARSVLPEQPATPKSVPEDSFVTKASRVDSVLVNHSADQSSVANSEAAKPAVTESAADAVASNGTGSRGVASIELPAKPEAPAK